MYSYDSECWLLSNLAYTRRYWTFSLINHCYPHMPIGKVWIYRLLFLCFFLFFFCVYLFVRLRISPARIKLTVLNFAQWVRGALGRESLILGNFALPEAQNRTIQRAATSVADRRQSPPLTASVRGNALSMGEYIRPSPLVCMFCVCVCVCVCVFVRLQISPISLFPQACKKLNAEIRYSFISENTGKNFDTISKKRRRLKSHVFRNLKYT